MKVTKEPHIYDWGVGSPCPYCGNHQPVYLIGPADSGDPDKQSVATECGKCGRTHKQDVAEADEPDYRPESC